MDPAAPLADEIVIRDGRIVEGTADAPRRLDLHGRCVLPGFTDSHVHFPTWALAQQQVRLEGTTTLDEALQRVAEAASTCAPGRWLRGLGWRAGDWTPHTEPTRHDLDRVAPGVPIVLMSRDYHSLWVSSAALEAAHGNLAIEGGVVETDEHGEPTGVLREEAAWHFKDRFAAATHEEMVDACRAAMPLVAQRGVTAVHDKDGWVGALPVFGELKAAGDLQMRVWQSIPADRLDQLGQLGIPHGLGDDMLRAGYVKTFLDGTLGSSTARLMDGSGVEVTTRADFEEVIRRSAALGFPVAVHAIGDRANRDALDAFEATREHWEPKRLRHRIEHTQLLTTDDLSRFKALDVTASVQFSHGPSDRDIADELWAHGTDRAYAYGSLHAAGARLCNGSDAPVEELDPLKGLRAGVLRTLDDRPAWHPEQRLTVAAALEAATVNPAWLAYDEHRRGRLMPGMLADLVVLDRDPMAIAPEELPEIRVEATMLGGRWTYSSGWT
jgi:predicted amidohydrolase YtcJ